ncbi:hypothetical protein OTU49_010773, partial [Cherax quadricarinatus]
MNNLPVFPTLITYYLALTLFTYTQSAYVPAIPTFNYFTAALALFLNVSSFSLIQIPYLIPPTQHKISASISCQFSALFDYNNNLPPFHCITTFTFDRWVHLF